MTVAYVFVICLHSKITDSKLLLLLLRLLMMFSFCLISFFFLLMLMLPRLCAIVVVYFVYLSQNYSYFTVQVVFLLLFTLRIMPHFMYFKNTYHGLFIQTSLHFYFIPMNNSYFACSTALFLFHNENENK